MPLATPLRALAVSILAAAVCASPPSVQAAEAGYQIQLGIIESDNIERLPSGHSDTVGVVELGLDWHEKRPWLDGAIEADISHLNYAPRIYNDHFIGNLLGSVKAQLVPDTLSWAFTDNFGQAPLQPLAPITPANQENVNYFGTGPTLTLPLGSTTRLAVTGGYNRVTYEVSPLDATVLTGGAGLLHELSPSSSISFNAKEEDVRFTNEGLNRNYESQEAFARLDTKGSRTQLGVDLGLARLAEPGLRDNIPLLRLDVSRRVSPTSTVGVAFGHDYSNGADSFRIVQAVGGATLNTQPIVAAADPFVANYATLAWNYRYARSTLDTSVSYYRDRYRTDATLDNQRTVFAALAGRQVSPVVQLAVTEYLVNWRFDTRDESATESDTGLQLTWRAGRNLSVFVAYFLAKGNSNVPTFDYTENRIWLSIGYGRAAEAPPGPAPLRLPGRQ